jgi:HSP20 family protein
MTLPVRRGTPGRLAERRFPGWARDPLAEFDDLSGRIGSLLESTVGGTLTPVTEGMAWSPLADVSETDDAYLIEIDVPGVKREDIDSEMGERNVTVRGEFKEREGAGTLRRGTRRTGHFEYRTLLPGDMNTEEVNAALRDGVLTITVPKAETTKPRHIEITAGD